MSVKTLFFAGAATFALCTGAQAQVAQVAIVGSQSNVADVYARQSRTGGTGGGPQRIDQTVNQSNNALALNVGNIRLGADNNGNNDLSSGRGGSLGYSRAPGQIAVVGQQSNKAVLTAEQSRGRTGNTAANGGGMGGMGGGPQRITQDVTQSNLAVPLNLNNIRLGNGSTPTGFVGATGR